MKFHINKFSITIILITINLFLFGQLTSQNKVIDSLLNTIKTNKQDTSYVKNLIKIGGLYLQNTNYIEAKKFAQQAINKAEVLNYKKGIFSGYSIYSQVYSFTSNFDSAIVIYNKLIKITDTINEKSKVGGLYISLGENYYRKGDYKIAIPYLLKALKTYEQINDTNGIISSYNGVAVIYAVQKNIEKALETYLRALSLAQKNRNEGAVANLYNSIGSIYYGKKDVDQALSYFLKSLAIKENLGKTNSRYKRSISVSSINVGQIYLEEKKYNEALKMLKKALLIGEEVGDKLIMASALKGLGNTYKKLNNYSEAKKQLENSLKIGKDIGAKEFLQECYKDLSLLFEETNDYKQALVYQKLYTSIKDTLYNTESSKQITEMNTKYESEKKDKELIKKDAEISMQQVQTEKQAVIKNGFIVGFVFLLGLIIFVYRGYKQKQKTNLLLNDKNQKITDSINYAKIIQSSILPPAEDLKKYLPQSFIFYQPKDIVSGDFYWLYPINEHIVIFAVVDCTGHGVPGALMSMLGYSLLEQIINQDKTENPAEILDKLNYLVIESLKQSESGDTVKNGMDMVIFKLDYKNYEMEFAGAKNPLYVIRDKNVIELKGDRKSIGLSASNTIPFTNQKLKLQSGDQLYAFSDGYVDQKGGNENKKFYSANFQKLLISINSLGNDEQQEQIENAFKNWKGTNDQIDDVLVFGIKI